MTPLVVTAPLFAMTAASGRGAGAEHAPPRARIQDWMTRLAEGDRAAIEPLYAALWPVVRRLTGTMLANPLDADDAAQEALLRVYANAAAFDPTRDAVPWVLGVAAYECRTLRRFVEKRLQQADHTGC